MPSYTQVNENVRSSSMRNSRVVVTSSIVLVAVYSPGAFGRVTGSPDASAMSASPNPMSMTSWKPPTVTYPLVAQARYTSDGDGMSTVSVRSVVAREPFTYQPSNPSP